MTATIISAGQTASGVTLTPTDQLIILPGGSATGVVNSGGSIIRTGVAIVSGSVLAVAAPSLAGASVSAGGRELVLGGGLATGAGIGAGGEEAVFAGGTASATLVGSGGVQTVLSGGFARGATVFAGGSATIAAGGTGSAMLLSGGTATIAGPGARATSASLSNGATVFVQQGGTLEAVSATASTTIVVQSGGIVAAGTSQASTLVTAGGIATGLATVGVGQTTVLNGGFSISGTAAYGGVVAVTAGGVVSSLSVGYGGVLNVLSGGIADGFEQQANLRNGAGQATISSGGLARNALVHGTLIVDGGRTEGTLLQTESFGPVPREVVLSGGRTLGTVGTQIISSGGVAMGTLLNGFGSQQIISSGAIGSGTQVFGESRQTVLNGGRSIGAVVSGRATQAVSGGGSATGTLIMSGGTQALTPGSITAGTELRPGGAIDLLSIGYTASGTADYDSGTATLTIVQGSYRGLQVLSGDYTAEFFHLADDGAGGTLITVDGTPCYCPGTRIRTPQGDVAIEALRIGHHVVTASGARRPIRWLGRRSYPARFANRNPDVVPVRIRAGALGAGLPKRDLVVSPLHAMLLDGVLVPASALVDGRAILQQPVQQPVEYIHIELDTHDIILAEGAPSETFVDDDSRGMFHNAHEYRGLYPAAVPAPARYCRPRVEEGEQLEAIRRRLAVIARVIGLAA